MRVQIEQYFFVGSWPFDSKLVHRKSDELSRNAEKEKREKEQQQQKSVPKIDIKSIGECSRCVFLNLIFQVLLLIHSKCHTK